MRREKGTFRHAGTPSYLEPLLVRYLGMGCNKTRKESKTGTQNPRQKGTHLAYGKKAYKDRALERHRVGAYRKL